MELDTGDLAAMMMEVNIGYLVGMAMELGHGVKNRLS